jgi:hypothetical protein
VAAEWLLATAICQPARAAALPPGTRPDVEVVRRQGVAISAVSARIARCAAYVLGLRDSLQMPGINTPAMNALGVGWALLVAVVAKVIHMMPLWYRAVVNLVRDAVRQDLSLGYRIADRPVPCIEPSRCPKPASLSGTVYRQRPVLVDVRPKPVFDADACSANTHRHGHINWRSPSRARVVKVAKALCQHLSGTSGRATNRHAHKESIADAC